MKRIQWVMILVLTLGLAPAQGAGNADKILKHMDRPLGLVHMPRGDVDLALALAERDKNCQIHLQIDDEAAVHAARERFDEAQLINRRVYVDRGNLKRLLPAANSCDLIVLQDLQSEELTPALAAELRRVLHPWYGVAILGNTSQPLDTQVLTGWAASIAESVEAVPDVSGLVMVKAGPLEGADNWSHIWHGPDNNAVSKDTAYSYPETIQWTGKPYDATRIDLHIVANGRLFSLWNGHLMDVTFGEAVLPGEEVKFQTRGLQTVMDRPLEEQRGPVLVARATGSGVRLWERRLSPAVWLQVSRSIVVAQGDRLLVGDGSTLLILDQATGQERQRLEMDCEQIKWIAATDQYVAVMGGPQFSRYPERMRRMTENVPPFRSAGLLLTVMNGNTLEPFWQERREKGTDAFDPRTPTIAGNRLFALTEGGEAQAFEIETGEIQWRMSTGIKNDKKVGYLWDRVSRHPIAGFAVAGLYIIGASEMDRCAVLSQEDGKPMWELERGNGPVPPLPMDYQNLVWFNGSARDPITGEEQQKLGVGVGGCGHMTAAPQGLVAQDGLAWDIIKGQSVPRIPSKSQCMSSQYVANGLIWRIVNGVWHIPEWRGFNVRAAAETDLPPAAPRLAVSPETSTPEKDVTGWTSYRAGNARSASVSSEIPDTVELVWQTPVAGQVVQDAPRGGTLLGPKVMLVPPVT
ncbi:MAG: PQQ-binding-like beta-propeller repeat protein, partial [Candidatus Sumerlaeota bacterium]